MPPQDEIPWLEKLLKETDRRYLMLHAEQEKATKLRDEMINTKIAVLDKQIAECTARIDKNSGRESGVSAAWAALVAAISAVIGIVGILLALRH